jgi:hypothetical protein
MPKAAQEQGKILFISELDDRRTEFVSRLLKHKGLTLIM